jgi:ABC-2 type transport system ATP-binding protein
VAPLRIEVENLSKTYEGGITALKPLNLTMSEGVFALLGPNGSGKTTFMRTLATLLEPTSGTARVDGLDIRRNRLEVRRLLGYLPQDFGFYPTLTVYEQLDYMALLCDLGGSRQRAEAIDRCMSQVNMTHFADRRVGGLSGGMRQRLGIAQALLNEPRLLIIDEPTAGLDPEERIRTRGLLAELGADRVVILSTHIVADVEAAADNVCILRFGDNLFTGKIEELMERVQGKVWMIDVTLPELHSIKEKYTVTGVYRTAGGTQVRVLADEVESPGGPSRPPARLVEPNLEDGYIMEVERVRGEAADA